MKNSKLLNSLIFQLLLTIIFSIQLLANTTIEDNTDEFNQFKDEITKYLDEFKNFTRQEISEIKELTKQLIEKEKEIIQFSPNFDKF